MKNEQKKYLRKFTGRPPKGFLQSPQATEVSDEQIRLLLRDSYLSKKSWNKFVSIYQDLFTDQETAELKARTHSVADKCRQLRNKFGCSFYKLYHLLLKETSAAPEFILDLTILDTRNRWDFIDSIYGLQQDI